MKTRHALALTLCAALALCCPLARAVPRVGSDLPQLSLEDGWGRTNHFARYKGMPTLVVYEDKDSSSVNQALKADLAKLAKGDKYKKHVALFAVADLRGYDYWPVRGFVKDAIRSESHKQGTVIYCDWDGHVQETIGATRGTSNVIFYGKNGKVLFAKAGALGADARAELIALLRAEVGDAG
jgi:hypothetical protein